MAAVAENDVSDIAYTRAVYHYLTRRDSAVPSCALLVYLEHLAYLGDKDIARRHSHVLGKLLMGYHVLVFAVNGHEIFRLCQRMHELKLLLTCVTGDVYLEHRIAPYGNAVAEQLVDDAVDHLFIAGDGACADNDEVAFAERDLAVIAECHAVERAHRLTLAAGGDNGHLLRRIFLDIGNVDEYSVRDGHIAELGSNTDDVYHAAPGDGDLSAELFAV